MNFMTCSTLSRLRTFSCATMTAPVAARPALPPVWSPCQWVFTTKRTFALGASAVSAAVSFGVMGCSSSSMTNRPSSPVLTATFPPAKPFAPSISEMLPVTGVVFSVTLPGLLMSGSPAIRRGAGSSNSAHKGIRRRVNFMDRTIVRPRRASTHRPPSLDRSAQAAELDLLGRARRRQARAQVLGDAAPLAPGQVRRQPLAQLVRPAALYHRVAEARLGRLPRLQTVDLRQA